ncbi:MAG: hypothetical protein DCC67_12605, partial [Planctomycetota bacterium]
MSPTRHHRNACVELFKVTCVTCRARLSVRDAALVGQIVACPRCGMMVQVTEPVDRSGNNGQAAAAPAAATAMAPSVSAEPSAGPPADQFAAALDDATMLLADAGAATAAADVPAPGGVAPPATPPAAPAGSSSVAYKFAAMIAGGSVAGSALVIVAV